MPLFSTNIVQQPVEIDVFDVPSGKLIPELFMSSIKNFPILSSLIFPINVPFHPNELIPTIVFPAEPAATILCI